MTKRYLEVDYNKYVLHGREVVSFDGTLSIKERSLLVKRITKSVEPMVMLTTFAVGAVGHNFQKFNMVLFLDRSWNPQVRVSGGSV
jgi:SNF2 family DNA or RNA helicase